MDKERALLMGTFYIYFFALELSSMLCAKSRLTKEEEKGVSKNQVKREADRQVKTCRRKGRGEAVSHQ